MKNNTHLFYYLWRDGYTPEADFRGKTKIKKLTKKEVKRLRSLLLKDLKKEEQDQDIIPEWSFDGSSTKQAEGRDSDCLLQPVRLYTDPEVENGWIVMCEVLNADGTPHVSNTRAQVEDDPEFWFGFEQEYVLQQDIPQDDLKKDDTKQDDLEKDKRTLGFRPDGSTAPQGRYYCGIGHDRIKGRDFVREHTQLCIQAGLGITGTNAEVMIGQWEFQIFGKGALRAADDLMVARFLLHRLGEKYEYTINIHPKPEKGDWNGSGMHVNFSNTAMRDIGGKEMFESICESFRRVHDEHIQVYGSDNEQRLTGKHETQAIDQFSYGVGDRGASIRIPLSVAKHGYKGYLEDRRPASHADAYRLVQRIMQTVKNAEVAV